MEVDSLLTEDKSEVKYQSFLFYNHYCPIKRFKTKIKDFSMQKHHRKDRHDVGLVFYNFLIKINIMGAILIETKDVSELTTQLLKSGKDFTALTNAKQFPHSKN
jgi:hypothetical protein